jgi:malonyl-CoA O-methyltransferase
VNRQGEQLAADFFDRFADTFDTLYDEKRGPAMRWVDRTFRSDMFIRFAWTFERMGPLEGKSVLDIGCGSGPYIVEALRRGAASVTGVDPAPGMIDLASRRLQAHPLAARVQLVTGFFPDVEVPAHDHAIVMGVFDYLADPLAFLRGVRRVTRESAQVSFPSRHWFRTPLRKVRYRLRHCPVFSAWITTCA